MSLFGTMLVQYAIMWHIVLKTRSGSMMTLYIIAGVLPTFFTSLFGGVWADRYDKKHLINLSDGSIAAVSLAIAITLFAGYDSFILLLIAAAVRALGQGVQQPAVYSLIPLIVPEDKLLKINGINGSIQSGILILSPILSASLMSLAPLETLFFIDVITAAIAIGILYFLVKVPHRDSQKKNTHNTSHFKDLIDGLKYIKSQKYLVLLVLLSTVYVIAMSPVAFLSPLQATRNFGADLWRLSAIEIGFAGGMMLGGILVGLWSFHNRIISMGMASCIFGIMTILLGLWTHFIPYLACMAICGIIGPYYHAPNMTLLQEKVAPEYLGRVLSVFTMLACVVMPFGMLVFGPLGDVININFIFIGTGTVMLLLGTLFFVSKTLRAAGMKNREESTEQE
jgi:DHA3 family macrolide efflux protein-like MFS transporter